MEFMATQLTKLYPGSYYKISLFYSLIDHESLKWHVPVFFFIRKPLYAFGFDVNLN